jgi:hypothetical protein
MNILLWVLQIALAYFCIAGGFYQIFKLGELQTMVASMRALPPSLWAFLGTVGILGGLGLIIPGATKLMPVLTPIAATVVAVESLFISVLYIYYGDLSPLIYSFAMTIMAVFISYGRFVLKPF